MHYERIHKAVFLSRPNRFIARIELGGAQQVCHVKNTGRCAELLLPGAEIYVQKSLNPARKTQYDLISVKKGDTLINMDSQAPNQVALEWLKSPSSISPFSRVRPETTWEDSRFDFYLEYGEQKAFMEVKGVTLEEQGVAMFPDAPTERGVKHIEGLCRCLEQGFSAYLLFVIQMKGITHFVPNDSTHPAFGDALRRAREKGVRLLAYDCNVTPDSLSLRNEIKIKL